MSRPYFGCNLHLKCLGMLHQAPSKSRIIQHISTVSPQFSYLATFVNRRLKSRSLTFDSYKRGEWRVCSNTRKAGMCNSTTLTKKLWTFVLWNDCAWWVSWYFVDERATRRSEKDSKVSVQGPYPGRENLCKNTSRVSGRGIDCLVATPISEKEYVYNTYTYTAWPNPGNLQTVRRNREIGSLAILVTRIWHRYLTWSWS